MVSKKLKEELKKFRKKLEKLETDQDKIVFLRDFILDENSNKELKDEAMEILNSLLGEISLENIVSHREDFSLKNPELVKDVEHRVIEIPVGFRRKVEDEEGPGHVDYSVGGGP